MSLRILHVLDHSIPLHSGYTFRTLSILREQRKLDLAIAEYNEALRLRPDLAIVHNNMGQALQEMGGHLAEAVKWYEQSIKLDPHSARAISMRRWVP